MQYEDLGKTGLRVSKICFGSLTTSPLQKNFESKEAAKLFAYGIREHGINFFDTAELYENYAHFKALQTLVGRDEFILSTKCYAYDRKTAEESLMRALREANTDYIDIFMLHEQESALTLRGHAEALSYFEDQKKKGLIRAIGFSTHYVKGVEAACDLSGVDVIHPIINLGGIGIVDGSRDQMKKAIQKATSHGVGCYLMKALGGGHLLGSYQEAIAYVQESFPGLAVAIGMQSQTEVDLNVKSLVQGRWTEAEAARFQVHEKKLRIADWCLGCGACIKACHQEALGLVDGKAVVLDQERCVRCGYCAKACKEFCIKVV